MSTSTKPPSERELHAARHKALLTFCACKTDQRRAGPNPRLWLCSPWREGDWVYYSDGRVIVRTPHTEAYAKMRLPGADTPSRGGALFAGKCEAGVGLEPLGAQPEPLPCELCNTKRTYEGAECLQCSGKGYESHGVPMFGASWDSVYLWMLSQLPSAMVRSPKDLDVNTAPSRRNLALEVIFDGGQALLMPRHERDH